MNYYRNGIPYEKGSVTGSYLLVKPITRKDVNDSVLETIKSQTNDAVLYEIIKTGPNVKDSNLISGNLVMVVLVALDQVSISNEFPLFCVDEQDVRLVFSREDMLVK